MNLCNSSYWYSSAFTRNWGEPALVVPCSAILRYRPIYVAHSYGTHVPPGCVTGCPIIQPDCDFAYQEIVSWNGRGYRDRFPKGFRRNITLQTLVGSLVMSCGTNCKFQMYRFDAEHPDHTPTTDALHLTSWVTNVAWGC